MVYKPTIEPKKGTAHFLKAVPLPHLIDITGRYKKNEKFKLIKNAKEFGFSPKEIKKFLVFWNK